MPTSALPSASFRQETYGELQPFIDREWLLTNGTGSFASSTVVGCNTRRYHGLLVAATLPPVGRILALSRLAETVAIENHVTPVELSINYFQQHLIPRGDRYLRSFELDDTARFEYDADGVLVSKEVMLCWGRPIVGIRYVIDPGPHKQAELRVNPFVALRDFHATQRKGEFMYDLTHGERACSVARHGLKLSMKVDHGSFYSRPDWWYDHTYPIETERGLDDREDLFTPGYFSVTVTQRTAMTLWASTNGLDGLEFEAERKKIVASSGVPTMPTVTQQRLARAAGQFIVRRNRDGDGVGASILAGFPWFADWGRDTMISLPGLLLSTGRKREAGQVLSVFAGHVSEGMIPNVFDDYSNEPAYNTVDASLWFIHAVHEYLRVAKDRDLYDSLLRPACEQIVAGYRAGTRFNIKMDETDCLISAGDAKTQLTWMDAKCAGIAFTPRHGKAVEINALWYNALMQLGETELAAKVKTNFAKKFYISPYRGLADVITDDHVDKSIRPNQIFAVSLPHSALELDQQRAVVEVVRRELLTPFGLKTLASGEPGYQPRITGNQFDRDKAYHNGTIWPWLIGGFLEAYLRVNARSAEAKEQAKRWLTPLVQSMEEGCLGSISECFEAQPPHRPVACYAQAWSVAEALRLAIELEM
ncbi:MAG: amylo-alpha-1,6-glucosidase [Tepidisphaeraceae bacterium]